MLQVIIFVSKFICNSFNDGVSNSEHVVSNEWMNWKALDGSGRGLI
jgi:hypothetical protein